MLVTCTCRLFCCVLCGSNLTKYISGIKCFIGAKENISGKPKFLHIYVIISKEGKFFSRRVTLSSTLFMGSVCCY